MHNKNNIHTLHTGSNVILFHCRQVQFVVWLSGNVLALINVVALR